MPLLNKLFGKKPTVKNKKPESEIKKPAVISIEKNKVHDKLAEFKAGKVLISPIATEKALSAQKLNQYVFKTAIEANKIEVAKVIAKNYNVKVARVNIINIPKKARRVGKTKGFKSGYKKAVVTLAEGQSIELK